jgi:TolB-like protein
MSFLSELRRRNVIRMAGWYVVGAWLIVQVASIVFPAFELPAWTLRGLILLLALGFVPALVFAWVFELTPDGLKREREVDRSQGIASPAGRKLDVVVIVLLLGVGAMMLWQMRGAPGPTTSAPAVATAPVASPPVAGDARVVTDKSIAVLPFADFSADGDQGWFADGLADEILNALTRTPDLLVSARTSSFRYKGSELAIPQIAQELGVAHVLEGSVRSTPQRIRVTAQLIRAADGFHLWSQTYDRDIADMIEIQEDLARQIAVAMQTSMDPQALSDMAAVGTRSVEAYQAYVRGVAAASRFDQANFKEAYEHFERARALDPAFAAAHARAAYFWLEQLDPTGRRSGLTGETAERVAQAFDQRIDLAIRHAANEVDRLRTRLLKARRDLRWREAIELSRALLAVRPGDDDTITYLLETATQVSDRELGMAVLDEIWPQALQREAPALAHLTYAHRNMDRHKAADLALQLLKRWPDEPELLYQVHRALLWDRRVEDAAAVLARWHSQGDDESNWSAIPPARQACAEGRRADAEAILAGIDQHDLSKRWHLLMLLGRTGEANDLLQQLERAGNTSALAGFLTYRHFDPAPFPSLMAVLERELVQRPPAVPLPFACPPAEASP